MGESYLSMKHKEENNQKIGEKEVLGKKIFNLYILIGNNCMWVNEDELILQN
jgi:hypothetical protein